MHAEDEYAFLHSVVRDVVYDSLALPDRARLHKLALGLFEDWTKLFQRPAFARELARHAAEAARAENTERQIRQREAMASAELRYLQAAAEDADRNFMVQDAARLWHEASKHNSATAEQRLHALIRGAEALRFSGRVKDAEQKLLEARALRPQGAARVKVAISLANALRTLGLRQDAEQEAAYALEVAPEPATRAEAQFTLGCLARDSGRTDEAVTRLQDAINLHRQCGNELPAARVEGAMGTLCANTGKLHEAERLFRGAMEAHIRAGDPRGEAIYAGNLSTALRELDRRDEAETLIQRALELHRSLGNRADEAVTHGNLAMLQKEKGRLLDAELSYRRALHILRDHENRIMEGVFLINMGNLLDDTNRTVHAVDCYEHAIMWFRRGGAGRQLGLALGNLGVARQKLGRLDDGLAALSEAIQLLETHKAVLPAGAFAALRGEQKLLLGDTPGAEADCDLASRLLDQPQAQQMRRLHLQPLQARLYAHAGKVAELRAMLEAFRAEFGSADPASEEGKQLQTLGKLLQGAEAGSLYNGHVPTEMPRELLRALAQRENQPAPLRERLLAAGA